MYLMKGVISDIFRRGNLVNDLLTPTNVIRLFGEI